MLRPSGAVTLWQSHEAPIDVYVLEWDLGCVDEGDIVWEIWGARWMEVEKLAAGLEKMLDGERQTKCAEVGTDGYYHLEGFGTMDQERERVMEWFVAGFKRWEG